MNLRGRYSDYDGRRIATYECEYVRNRTMKQIKADYNDNLQRHSLSKVKKHK